MELGEPGKTILAELGKKAAAEVWEKKGRLRDVLARIVPWFARTGQDGLPESQPGILILGPAGAGKTTLARLLSGDVDVLLDPPGQYAASVGVERYNLLGAPAVEVVVPPGQPHRRETTWTDLLSDVAAGLFRGVILVTAFGYQSIAPDSYKGHPLFAARKAEFVPALLGQQRVDELAVLDRLGPVLRVAPNRLWLLSVVAKQDLWWPARTEVEKYHREGAYHVKVAESFGPAGRPNFRHEVCMVSLVIQNWTTRANEVLVRNAAGYDHVLHRGSIRRLLETIDSLRQWEAEA